MTTSQAIDVRRIAAHGVELSVATSGSGPALLLVYGWPHTRRVWDAVLPRLAERFTVIAPDLRGLGDSQRARDGYYAGSLARDLRRVLDACGAGSCGRRRD